MLRASTEIYRGQAQLGIVDLGTVFSGAREVKWHSLNRRFVIALRSLLLLV